MTKKISVAVTGIGGGVGQSIIKALHDSQYRIVGLDGEILAAGIYAVPVGYRIPYAHDPQYIDTLLKICKKEDCKLLFPGLDAELAILSLHKKQFEKIGTTVVVSSPEVIEISDNKLLTQNFLAKCGLPVIHTLELSSFLKSKTHSSVNFPLILKPKIGGARSKDVFLLKKREDLTTLLKLKKINPNNFIVQEYIEGDEYTCGTVNINDVYHGAIIMRRILRDGDTYKCFSVKNEIIEKAVATVMTSLKPFGACNVQLRLRNNVPYIFEINARCSGTTAARALAGFNEPKMIADYLLHNLSPTYHIKEISILRYWKELVVENKRIKEFEKKQAIINTLHVNPL